MVRVLKGSEAKIPSSSTVGPNRPCTASRRAAADKMKLELQKNKLRTYEEQAAKSVKAPAPSEVGNVGRCLRLLKSEMQKRCNRLGVGSVMLTAPAGAEG